MRNVTSKTVTIVPPLSVGHVGIVISVNGTGSPQAWGFHCSAWNIYFSDIKGDFWWHALCK